MSKLILSAVVGFITTAFLIRVLYQPAIHMGLVDKPDHRKSHSGAVPLVGGIAIFLALALALYIYNGSVAHLRSFAMASLILLLAGVLDDLHELSSAKRFVAQILAAAIMVYGANMSLASLGALGLDDQSIMLGRWSVPLTVFAVVGVINALNMIDGIDGLSCMSVLVALSASLYLAWGQLGMQQLILPLLLLPCVLAFMLFNLLGGEHSKVFLGDTGSMFLGFVLAWVFVGFSQSEQAVMRPVTALWIFALPLMDTVGLIGKRIIQGRSPFSAGRDHIHHILLKAGLGPLATLLVLTVVAISFAAIGLFAEQQNIAARYMFWIFLAMFVCYLLAANRFWTLFKQPG